jgi:two-component system chemotaxis sensor kinase CheA
MESPGVRRQLGKPETGTITLAAEMREGNIVITVADDGAGLNYEKIRNIAVEKGLISRDAARSAGEQEISEYLFLSGFSTKTEVSTISGRGVGMDVVRSNVKSLGGSVEISGKAGEGTIVTLIIPQTLSILTCLIVECAGFRFVVPQQNIVEVVRIDQNKLKTIQSKKAYELRNRLLPLVETNVLIGLAGKSEAAIFLVLKTEKYHFGLTVDSILDTEEVVVKSLPHFNDDNQLFAGAAIMGDAQIALILDAAGIGKKANLQLGDTDRSVRQAQQLERDATRHLLFTAGKKQMAFRIFSNPRIERIHATAVEKIVGRKIVNFRGEIIPLLPLDFLIEQDYAAGTELALIILQSDSGKYGILADEVMDVISDMPAARRDESNSAQIEGITILGEATVVLLNIPRMIERAAHGKPLEIATGATP